MLQDGSILIVDRAKKKQTRKQESERDSGRNDFSVSAPEGGWKAGDEFQIRSNSSL